jgi:hypothetical protein
MDLDDFRELLGHGRLEQAAAGVAVQLQERGHGQPDGAGVDAGVVALDDSGLFQPADPGLRQETTSVFHVMPSRSRQVMWLGAGPRAGDAGSWTILVAVVINGGR